MSPPKYVAPMRTDRQAEGDGVDGDGADGERPAVVGWRGQRPSGQVPHAPACRQDAGLRPAGGSAGGRGRTGRLCQCLPGRPYLAPWKAPGRPHLAPWEQVVIGQVVKQYERGAMAPWRDGALVRIGQIGRIPGWIGSTRTSWQTRLLLIRTAWSPS